MKTDVLTNRRFSEVLQARQLLEEVVLHTPLHFSQMLSDAYKAEVWLKREDRQRVRSYKIRGAYNKIATLSTEEKCRGVVCASAGNHAQGVAYSCNTLRIGSVIFMPVTTPQQKVKQVIHFGREFAEVCLVGDTFDDAYAEAMRYACDKGMAFIHPFDDDQVIAGQGTVALEILEDMHQPPDYLFVPVGCGGLAAGISTVIRQISPRTKLMGVQPCGAPSMKKSLDAGCVTELEHIDKFVDGASVKRPGLRTFDRCRDAFHDFLLVHEGAVCAAMIRMYNEEAIVLEPAGALSIAALDSCKDQISGKKVVCILSGGNSDWERMLEIKERALMMKN